jgi:hypothetical protein
MDGMMMNLKIFVRDVVASSFTTTPHVCSSFLSLLLIVETVNETPITDDVIQWKSNFDHDNDGHFTLDGLKQLYFSQAIEDAEEVRSDMKKLNHEIF